MLLLCCCRNIKPISVFTCLFLGDQVSVERMWVLYLVLKAMLSNLKVSNSCFFILSLSVVETKRSSYTYTARNSQVAAGVLQACYFGDIKGCARIVCSGLIIGNLRYSQRTTSTLKHYGQLNANHSLPKVRSQHKIVVFLYASFHAFILLC